MKAGKKELNLHKTKITIDSATLAALKRIFIHNLQASQDETVLLVTDPNMLDLEAALWIQVAQNLQLPLELYVLEDMTHSGQEPPAEVIAAAERAPISIFQTTYSLTHTQAGKKAVLHGGRAISLPGADYDLLRRTLAIDYAPVRELGEKIKAALQNSAQSSVITPASTSTINLNSAATVSVNLNETAEPKTTPTLRITSTAGTQLTTHIRTTGVINDCGFFAPGELGNLPAGEVFFAPLLGSTNGTLVIDGSIADDVLDEPIVVTIENGLATKMEGGTAAQNLWRKLSAFGQAGLTVAEVGIGTNPAAQITGNLLEAEKAYGTVHVAFGNSSAIGGENDVAIHIDGLIAQPVVTMGTNTILKNRKFEL